jgi:HD-GYP domain-containing protein (c-di-GMP phosphodiesterase class II)
MLRREFPSVEVIVITGCGSVESAAEAVRQGICDYLQKPFDVVQVTAAVARAVARRSARSRLCRFLEELGDAVGRDREAQALLDDVHASQRLRGRLGEIFEARGERDPLGQVAARRYEFLELLAETIETKDRFMRGHARRVAFYSGLIAERLGLDADEREQLRLSAFLHDLGKVGVPTDLLLRPGALEPGERRVVEQHAAIGARLVAPLDLPSGTALALRHHHEWWDGTGYPDGIAGERIPLAARIIGAADAFDAMTCDRPYRRALARDVVVSELWRYSGSQFDPDVAEALLACVESGLCDFHAATPAEAESATLPAAPTAA